MSYDLIPGSSQYLGGAAATAHITKDTGTICGWFAPDFASTTTSNYTWWDTGTAKVALRTSGTASVLTCEVDGRTHAFTVPTAWTTGTWHHFAMQYNKTAGGGIAGDLIQLFIDGVKCTEYSAITGTWGSGTPAAFYLGANASAANFFDGKAAEFAIYSTVLSEYDIACLAQGYSPLMVRGIYLNGYWPLTAALLNWARAGTIIPVINGTALTNASHPSMNGIDQSGGLPSNYILNRGLPAAMVKMVPPWTLGIEGVTMKTLNAEYWSGLVQVAGFRNFSFRLFTIATGSGAAGAATLGVKFYGADGVTPWRSTTTGTYLSLATAHSTNNILNTTVTSIGAGFAGTSSATINAQADLPLRAAAFAKFGIIIPTASDWTTSYGSLTVHMST